MRDDMATKFLRREMQDIEYEWYAKRVQDNKTEQEIKYKNKDGWQYVRP